MFDKIYSVTKYILSGGIGFMINICIFWFLINYTNIWYVYSSIISFILSTFIGFNLHKTITYSDKSKTNSKKIISYYILNIINILINSLLIFIFVEYLYITELISLIICNALIAIYSYVVYKNIIFK